MHIMLFPFKDKREIHNGPYHRYIMEWTDWNNRIKREGDKSTEQREWKSWLSLKNRMAGGW
jgi:hypothetical protein